MDLHPGEQVVFEGHPSWRALLSFYIGGVAAALAIAVVIALLSSFLLGLPAGAVLVGAVLGFGLLKRTARVARLSVLTCTERGQLRHRHRRLADSWTWAV
jgi:phosphate/sulfate permease